MTDKPLLRIEDLTVSFNYRGKRVEPVSSVNLEINAGESVGLVGESGSGKTTLGLSILRLLPRAQDQSITGRIGFRDQDVLTMSDAELATYRGAGVGIISQDPMTSLNPTLTIGDQLREAFRDVPSEELNKLAIKTLSDVGLPDPASRLDAYPHHLSGGMRQRVVGGIALAGAPDLLIADEPTTALDVTVQLQFIDLLKDLRATHDMALLFISHDLPVVARIADRIIVMYAGSIVEDGPTNAILNSPRHWYTAGLVACARDSVREDGRLETIEGQPPPINAKPPGCPFAPRCPVAGEKCNEPPPLTTIGQQHVRCWFPHKTGEETAQ